MYVGNEDEIDSIYDFTEYTERVVVMNQKSLEKCKFQVSFGLRTQNLNLEVEITFLNFRFLQRSSDLSKGEY